MGTGDVHESVLRSLGSFSPPPCCVARCIWELQCWDFWDSVSREEAFLTSPLELVWSSLCLLGQAGTDQKLSAMLSAANKGHSSPAGQCLFCPTFACSCKWFIKNYSIFLLSFCTLNGQIFFSCNSVLDSLYLFALFLTCGDEAWPLCAGHDKSSEIK